MAGLFISYRRTDTLAWAGRLFADLSKSFGPSQVFMDINGGIARGADFERVLTTALMGCDAMLCLVGPQWAACKRSDGTRRLDVSDDWVRNEIATALRRNVPVVPILLGSAQLPSTTDLPEEMRGLVARQGADVSDTRWDYDVRRLVGDLVLMPPLRQLYDVAAVNAGLERLKQLIETMPAVAETVSRSKEVIENTLRELDRLEQFKLIHDALHTIELECLQPMQAGGPASPARPYKSRFAGASQRITAAMQNGELDENLQNDVVDGLESVATAFQAAIDTPGEATFAQVVDQLIRLVSFVPAQIDVGISQAAQALNLDRLADLMAQVRATLPSTIGPQDTELGPLISGIDSLNGLRDQLKSRVLEHGVLQRLDTKLLAVCFGGMKPGTLVGEWSRIKLARSRLAPPYSPELTQSIGDLAATESDVEKALAAADERSALGHLRDYFSMITSTFRDVDTSLKQLCLKLGAVSQPLKAIMAKC